MAGEIGKRAAEAIRKKANDNDTSYAVELRRICISREQLYQWEHGKCDPTGKMLQQMALAGYDVVWILTGRASDGNRHN